MEHTFKQVFLIIGLLLLVFLSWLLLFTPKGIVANVYNTFAQTVSMKRQEANGGDDQILPYWGQNNTNQEMDFQEVPTNNTSADFKDNWNDNGSTRVSNAPTNGQGFRMSR